MTPPKLPATAKAPAAPASAAPKAVQVTPITRLPRNVGAPVSPLPAPAPAFAAATSGTVFDALPAATAALRSKAGTARQLLSAAVRSAQAALVAVKDLEAQAALGVVVVEGASDGSVRNTLAAEGLDPVTLEGAKSRLAALVDAYALAPAPSTPPPPAPEAAPDAA